MISTLKNLDYEVMQKITAIILFDDVHTATAWRILEKLIKQGSKLLIIIEDITLVHRYPVDIHLIGVVGDNNCKSLFPIWINWTYIKELFIMPNGLTEDGTKDAADI